MGDETAPSFVMKEPLTYARVKVIAPLLFGVNTNDWFVPPTVYVLEMASPEPSPQPLGVSEITVEATGDHEKFASTVSVGPVAGEEGRVRLTVGRRYETRESGLPLELVTSPSMMVIVKTYVVDTVVSGVKL